MDRCELALANHKNGYNCAQSVVLAFAEDTGVSRETLLAIVGGMGGGVGGSDFAIGQLQDEFLLQVRIPLRLILGQPHFILR